MLFLNPAYRNMMTYDLDHHEEKRATPRRRHTWPHSGSTMAVTLLAGVVIGYIAG